jgi:hypothetical protein
MNSDNFYVKKALISSGSDNSNSPCMIRNAKHSVERNRQSISIGTNNLSIPLVRHLGFFRIHTILVETIESSADLAS